jgi:hypothetical protein
MEKIIKVNVNWLFSDEHFLMTDRGWIKAKELQNGDKIIGYKGESTIENIIKCEKQPDASIIGETGAVEN